MLGIKEDVKDLKVSIMPNGRGIDVFINDQMVSKDQLKGVQEIAFRFSLHQQGWLTVDCTKTETERTYSKKKRE